jgi:hypothetical protein
MAPKECLLKVSLLLIMTALSGCTVSSTSQGGPPTAGVPATCQQDQSVVGCIAGAKGYSCSGTDSPDESNSALSCSEGTPSSGGPSLYCCVDTSSVPGCAADSSVVGCTGASIGFSCTGSLEPQQSDSSLVCSSGTPSGSATLFCCATYTPSTGTCKQDTAVQGCMGSSIGFSCTGSDTPTQVNSSLACSQGTSVGGGTQYCCDTGGSSAPPMMMMTTPTTPTCIADLMVMCTSPASGYSCVGAATPMQSDATLTCGQGMLEADKTTLAYCCNAAAAPACAADPSVTGCPGVATGYTCTGGANPMTSTLLCGAAMAGPSGAMSYCCTTN